MAVLGRQSGWIMVLAGSGLKGWVVERYSRPTGATPAQVSVPAAPAVPPPPPKPISALQTGSFTQEDTVALHNRYRKALTDGDLNAFVACIYEPPGGVEAGPSN